MRKAIIAALALSVCACDCSPRVRYLIDDLEVTPSRIDFGGVPLAQSRQKTLTLHNAGSSQLSLQDTVLTQPGSVFSRGAFPRVLEVGQSVDVEVSYQPDGVLDDDEGSLGFKAEGADATLGVQLSGHPLRDGAGGGSAGGGSAGGGSAGGGSAGGGSAGGGSAGGGSAGGGGFVWPFDGGYTQCSDAGDTVELALLVSDAGYQIDPRIVLDTAGFILTWSDNSSNNFVAKVARLSPAGAITSAPQTLLAPNPSLLEQRQPVIATSPDAGYAAMLQYQASSSQDVYFATIDSSLSATGLSAPGGIGYGTSPQYLPSWPTPVWNPVDREWGLFWHQIGSAVPDPRYTLWMGRSRADGTYIERHPISPQETATFSGPVFGQGAGRGVVWNGDGYALAYVENHSTGLSLTRLSRDGGFVSSATTGSIADVFPNTSLAWNGSEYGVLWLEWGSPSMKVLFRLADANGAFVGQTIEVAQHPAISLQADHPRPLAGLVWTGDGWLVVWLDFDSTGVMSQLWAVKLAPDGSEIAGTRRPLTCGAQATMLPDVIWAGEYAAIAYTRGVAGMQPQRVGLILHRP